MGFSFKKLWTHGPKFAALGNDLTLSITSHSRIYICNFTQNKGKKECLERNAQEKVAIQHDLFVDMRGKKASSREDD